MRRPGSVLAILGSTENFGEAIEWIRRRGLTLDLATTGEKGIALQRERNADLVLVGLPLPDYAASMIIGGIKHHDPRTPIVVVGSDDEVSSQLEALELGAQDYIAHPHENRRDLLFALGVSLGVRKTDAQFRVLRSRQAALADWRRIVAHSPPMREVMRRLREVCERTLSGATPTVLLSGEIGTGKRLLAHALHYNGARRNRAFGEIHCAMLSGDELRAQLFGRASGAPRQGLLEIVDGGTMFLDEIAGAPLDVQDDILIALEDRFVRRGGETIPIDVQFVVSTRRDLEALVKRGEFRASLYHRLSVTSIPLPPLRDRGDDIMVLADWMARDLATEHGVERPTFGPEIIASYRGRAWRGNLRELRNEVERAVLFGDESVTSISIEGDGNAIKVAIGGDRCSFEQLEREVIRQALVRSGGNVSRAARFLVLTRQTLLYRMKKFGFTHTTQTGETLTGETEDKPPT